MKLKIGTRKSKLAMWQANFIKDQLEQHGIVVDLLPIETKGDKVLNVSISKIGSKGVFTVDILCGLSSMSAWLCLVFDNFAERVAFPLHGPDSHNGF